MNIYKNNKGITLVALVITVIILIILAGVSINMIAGQDGIFDLSKKARENYIASQEEEQRGLNELIEEMLEPGEGRELEIIYTASGYEGIYTGETRGVTITIETEGTTLEYSTDGGESWTDEAPEYADVGNYTVTFMISKEGYRTVVSTVTIIINKADGDVVPPTPVNVVYDGTVKYLATAGSTTTGTIQYKLEGGEYSESIPTAVNAGTYSIYYKVVGSENYNDVPEQVISSTIQKADNVLRLSETSGTVLYPNTKTFTITRNDSGGNITLSTSPANIVTVSRNSNTVTITPVTTEGTAIITVSAAATSNYNATSTNYTVTVTSHTHNYSTYLGTTATCTSSGYDTYRCSCGETATYSRAALGHSYGSWVTVTGATCSSSGSKKRTCSRCGNEDTGTIPATGNHVYTYQARRSSLIRNNATCTTGTQYYYECQYCMAYTTSSYWTDSDALGHSGSRYITTTEPSCTQAGVATLYCDRCGANMGTQSIPANGHSWGSWSVSGSTRVRTCSVCGATDSQTATQCSACNGTGWVSSGGGWSCPALSGQSVSYTSSATMVTRPSTQHHSTCRYYGTASWGVSATNEKCNECDTVNLKKGSQTCDECGFVFEFGKARKNYSHAAALVASIQCSTCGGTGYVF